MKHVFASIIFLFLFFLRKLTNFHIKTQSNYVMVTTAKDAIINAKLKTTFAAPRVVEVVGSAVVVGGGGAGTNEKITAS